MLRCFSLKPTKTSSNLPSSSSSLPITLEHPPPRTISSNTYSNSAPQSPTITSPTLSLTHEYSLALHTHSYDEIWAKIHQSPDTENQTQHLDQPNQLDQHLVSQVLHPNRESVDQALNRAKPTALTRLISTYFDHSEHTSLLLFHLLNHIVSTARFLYAPLHDLLDVLSLDPSSSISQPQCNRAIEIFHQFHHRSNPFPDPTSQNFQDMRLCFSQLKQQLDHRLRRLRRRSNPFRTTVLCLTGPLNALPPKFIRKQLCHIAQLDAASRGAYVLNNDLDTIDRLVARLHAGVESDKLLVRIGLERGGDIYPIQEVLKQLKKNHFSFVNQLKDLEEHVCLCFAQVNRARALLLQEIHGQQNV